MDKFLIISGAVVLIIIALAAAGLYFWDSSSDNEFWLTGSYIAGIIANVDDHKKDAYKAQNAVDGDSKTVASPPGKNIDFTIELLQTFDIRRVEVLWKENGKADHTSDWAIMAKDKHGDWEPVFVSDAPPLEETSIVEFKAKTDALRLIANHSDYGTGVYEFKIFAVETK